MNHHNQVVALVASAVRQFHDRNETFRIYHGSTNSTRPPHQRERIVDTSQLSNVLKVDTVAKTILVEPNVSMDRLVETTLKYGLIPPVVMEFPGITVGGAFSGTSGESSSFKYGFFNDTVNYAEIVLANGLVVRASKTERVDLFYGAAGSVGTLGVVTLLELQLIPAKAFVDVVYHPVSSIEEAIQTVKEHSTLPSIDYLDAILFSPYQGVVVTGRLTNCIDSCTKIQTFNGAWDPWFYLHAQRRVQDKKTSTTLREAIPIEDYLFRYDRGGFWVGRSVFDYFKFPFNSYTRWLFDDLLRPRMMYRGLHESGESKRYIVQDLALPFETAGAFINYAFTTLGISPLWLCPLRQSRLPTLHPHLSEYDADGTLKPLLSIGLWGYGPRLNLDDWVGLNRDIESKLVELKGMKWLYAHTYYTALEFWKIYDRQWYEDLRVKYNAGSLPTVYEKVWVDIEAEKRAELRWSQWLLKLRPFGAMWGIGKAIQSGEYLKARRSTWKPIESTWDLE